MNARALYLLALALLPLPAAADEVADEAPAPMSAWRIDCLPDDGARDQPASINPGFDFGRPMNPATLGGATLSLSGADGMPVPAQMQVAGDRVTLAPTAPLAAGGAYTTRVSTGARDRDGQALDRDYRCAFTVASPPPPMAGAPPPVSPGGPFAAALSPWYLAGLAAYAFPVCDDCVERGPGWQLAVGRELARQWKLELALTDREADLSRAPGSVRDTSLTAQVLWLPAPGLPVAPFVLAGAGFNRHESSLEPSGDSAVGTVGAGALARTPVPALRVRGGVQWMRPFAGDYCGKGDTVATVGLQWAFGR